MRRILSFTAILTAALSSASGAHAQELARAEQRVELNGNAPAACVANAGRAANPVNASFQSTGPNSGTVMLRCSSMRPPPPPAAVRSKWRCR